MAGGRERRRRRRRRKGRQVAATTTHISSLGDDLRREIFLRLPSLATLVRAAGTCSTWRHAVASSPAFRRRFSALHPAPLLGLFAGNDCFRLPLPVFAPADSSDEIDPDVLAAIRGGDFGLTSLVRERDGDAPDPRRWSIASSCRDGYLLLVDWDAGGLLALLNPLSRRRLGNNILLPYQGMVAGRRGYMTCLRNVHWLSSDEDPMPLFRLIWLCHDESRVRAAVFSSDTWDWRVLPWVDVEARPPPYDDDEDFTEWLQSGTEANGLVCWRIKKQERVLTLDTKTMEFSVWELPPPCWKLEEDWPPGSVGVVVGETKHGEPCIVRDTEFGIDVLMRGVDGDDDGAEKWLVDGGILNWHDAALLNNYGRLDLLGIKNGLLYLATAEMVLSLSLETMEMTRLFPTPTGHHFDVARFYPYFMAWPACLLRPPPKIPTKSIA